MIDFLIMYEVRVRELESIILLGNELKKRGYSVEYLSFDFVNLKDYINNRKLLKKYFNNVKVVLMPSLYHNKELYNIVYYVAGNCKNIVNLRWEQYFSNKVMNNTDSFLFPHELAKKAYHVCWGEWSYETLLHAGIDDNKLLKTGALQLDFLRKELSQYYLNREKLFEFYKLPNDKKTVLYMSSFASATMTERQFKGGEKDFDGAYKKDDAAVSFSKKSYESTLNWINELLSIRKDITFVYRPHPSENITGKLEELSDKYSNFRIISDYSVKQWILTCDCILTWVSTSIVEAYFAGKSCFIVRPVTYEFENDMSVYRGARFIDNKKDFFDCIDRVCECSVSEEMMKRCYYYDSDAAYIKLSNCLEKILRDEENEFEWDEDLANKFEKSRRKLLFNSVLANLYRIVIGIMAKITSKVNLSFGTDLDSRIENYLVKKKKDSYETYNKKSFVEIDNRIREVLNTQDVKRI